MPIEPYHLGRYSSIGSRPDVRGAIQESDDLVNHKRGGSTSRDLTNQDELDFIDYWLSPHQAINVNGDEIGTLFEDDSQAEIEMAINVNGDEIGTLVNVNEKNPEDDDQAETEMAIDVNGDEIGTLVNENEKNPEDNDQTPRIGKKFSSELEAEESFKKYAKKIGFTVRKGKVQRNANGTVTVRCFLCSCQGFRIKKDTDQGTKYQRSETRTGCLAQMQVKLESGQWVITKLHLGHNHRLQCLDTLNGPSDELEGASGADKDIQTFFAPTEAEDRDKTLTDPNTTAAGLLEMVEGSGVTSNTRESIWQQILTKYGDVTASCSFRAPIFVEIFKGSIVRIVELMQKKTARDLSAEDIDFIDTALSDLEMAQIKVDWLRSPFVAAQPLFEYAQAEGKRDVILRHLNEKMAEVQQLRLQLTQTEARLQELQHQITDRLKIDDTLGKGLL